LKTLCSDAGHRDDVKGVDKDSDKEGDKETYKEGGKDEDKVSGLGNTALSRARVKPVSYIHKVILFEFPFKRF